MTKLIQTSAMSVSGQNLQNFSTSLTSSNMLEISNIECDADINISGISQKNKVELKQKTEAKNEIKNTLVSNVSNDVASAILGKHSDSGSSLSDVTGQVAGTANNLINTYGDIMGSAFGGSTSSEDITNIDESVTANIKNEIENTMNKSITEENIQNSLNEIAARNDLKIKDLRCGGSATIEGIDQENMITAFIETLFSNERTNEMSDEIVQKLSDKLDNVNTAQGDIAAAGDALAQNVTALGEAAPGLGQGVGNAAKPFTEAASSTAKTFAIVAGLVVCFAFLAVFGWLFLSGSNAQDVGSGIASARGL